MTSLAMPLVILIPFAGALICFVGRERIGPSVGLVTSFATATACVMLMMDLVASGVQTYTVGHWAPPLGIRLYLDGLSLLHLLMTAAVGVVISIYARSYFAEHHPAEDARAANMFWPLWLFLWGALNALYLSADIFNIYVILEVIGLSAVALIALTGRGAVLVAAMRYLLAAMGASIVYLLGVALLYAAYSTLDIHMLGTLVQHSHFTMAALALMLTGLLLKTAIFPLHFWLPPAHSNATAPVSAILSALVVKASFYLILRLWFQVFHDVITISAGQLMGVLGSAAILWGSIQALRQVRLKMMIAYSTVAQLGYLLFIFPVAAVVDPSMTGVRVPWLIEAGKGAMYHGLSHALAKASLFLSAGILLHAAGSDHLTRVRGLAERLPLTVFAMALAGVNLMGLPPSGGFIAKWLTMHAVLGVGQWWWAPVIVVGGLLTAGYMFMMLRSTFLPGDPTHPLRPVSRTLELCALLLAALSIVIGLRASDLLDLLMIGFPFAPLLLEAGTLP